MVCVIYGGCGPFRAEKQADAGKLAAHSHDNTFQQIQGSIDLTMLIDLTMFETAGHSYTSGWWG